MPPTALISKVFPGAVAPFIAATIEHLAIAKAFARKNNYTIDPAQELVYLGVTNFFNSFFSAMPIGGAMSRTAVNSATGVRSPLYGLITGAFVLISIFALSPALFWIPKATLAAIIVVAVWSILSPPSTFVHYWKTSFIDFTASMLAFWVTLFVNTETGIGCAVGFQLVCHILYTTFSKVRHVTHLTSQTRSRDASKGQLVIAPDTQVFKPRYSLVFFNAFSIKAQCMDMVQTFNLGTTIPLAEQEKTRNWSTAGERRAKELRRRGGLDADSLTPVRVVVVDMDMVPYIDETALVALKDLKVDLERYAGRDVEVRFAAMHAGVRDRFERFGWAVLDAENVRSGLRDGVEGCIVYNDVVDAVADRYRRGGEELGEVRIVGNEKA
jgi:sodium-independent sulfate anion transporter 11